MTLLLLSSCFMLSDIESGPKVGEKVPELKAFGRTGEFADKTVNYTEERADLPTVYLMINASKFDRPMARYMRELDQKSGDAIEKVQIIAVWIGGDLDENKKRLPLIQQSLKFDRTAMAVFEGEMAGPNKWGINNDAHLTTVVVHKAVVVKNFVYQSVNEKDADKILEALKALKK
jgi:hypothetical protein